MKNVIFSLLFFLTVNVAGKEIIVKIDVAIDHLEQLHQRILQAPDTSKIRLNEEFKQSLNELLHDVRSLTYDLSALKSVSVLTAPRNKFRIYTWPLEISPGNYDYFGFTQYLLNKKSRKIKVVELENAVFNLTHEMDKSYEPTQWRGGLYYSLIPSKKKNSKNFLLLGWDGHNKRSTKKMIEVISFTKKGNPVFGAPILNFEAKAVKKNFRVKQPKEVTYQVKYRHEFEYSSKVSMMLRYDKGMKMVVYDHLTPMNPKLISVKATYVPDYSYDGLYLKKGKWYMKSNLDLRNGTLPKAKKYKSSDVKQ
ncbi:MAG: hypothetical protein ACJA0Q_001420 [Saprospiraceae bacterium]|jgi:hypothetical protein